jgi:hypothetical protein
MPGTPAAAVRDLVRPVLIEPLPRLGLRQTGTGRGSQMGRYIVERKPVPLGRQHVVHRISMVEVRDS